MNLVTQNNQIDLPARACKEMIAGGFLPSFEPPVIEEVKQVAERCPADGDSQLADLRRLLWSSIDNPESRDLDQIEYVEKLPDGNVRLMIALADVDSFVPKGSATDLHAYHNTTSVYTGVTTFPMLPDDLSFNITSLLQDVDRQAIIIDLRVNNLGAVLSNEIYLGLVRNHAKLDYPSIGTWLENGHQVPAAVQAVPGLATQLLLQSEVKEHMRLLRTQQGALHLHTTEATTVSENGVVLDIEEVDENPARDLIENFMITGNIAVSHFLASKQIPSIRRIVKTPEKWPRIVEVAAQYGNTLPAQPDARALAAFLIERKELDALRFADLSLTIVKLLGRGEYAVEIPGQADIGHFALAVHDYTHATAPNRRYADLVTQRLIKAAIVDGGCPYRLEELNAVAEQCTEREDAAKKVERTMRKVAAAVLLSKHIGETYEGLVTGIKDGATYVRLLKPPVEGRIISGEHGLDVGNKVQLRLVATDPERAFIDFACLSKHHNSC